MFNCLQIGRRIQFSRLRVGCHTPPLTSDRSRVGVASAAEATLAGGRRGRAGRPVCCRQKRTEGSNLHAEVQMGKN